jgi:hypothetical protein
VFLHYFIVSMPAQYLAAGYAVVRIATLGRPAVHWGTVAGVLVVAVAQAGLSLALLRFLGTHATPGGFGVPLQYQMLAAERARAGPTPVVVVTAGDDPATKDWPAVFDVWLREVPHRFVDGRRAALFTDSPATGLVTPGVGAAAQIYSLAGLRGSQHEIPTRPGEASFYVTRTDGRQLPDLSSASEPNQLANGIKVTGYRVNGHLVPGEVVEWWIAWTVVHPPSAPVVDYNIFNHLVNEEGIRQAQADGPTTPAKDWEAGDVVIQTFQIKMPTDVGPGPFWMRVGMYSYPALENHWVLDEAGNPISDAIKLGPLKEP